MTKATVLEATIVACIMLSAVTFVATQEAANEAPSLDWHLSQRASDFLAIVQETPARGATCGAESALEELVAEGVAGQRQHWGVRRTQMVPAGVAADLFLHNGVELLPLQVEMDGLGIAATKAVPLQANAVKTIDRIGSWGGMTSAGVETLAVRAHSMIATKGEAVRTSVGIEEGLGVERLSAWTPTALAMDPAADITRVQNFSWTALGAPGLVKVLSPAEMLQQGSLSFFLSMSSSNPTNTGLSGVELSLAIPTAWEVNNEVFEPRGWKVDDESVKGGHKLLKLVYERNSSDAILELRARPPAAPTRPFDTFTAHLGNGSLGQSTLVVQYPVAAERDLPMLVYPTTPYPLRPDGVALFGVALANGGPTQRITQVDLEIPGGYDLARHGGKGAQLFRQGAFEEFEEVDDGNWTWIDGRHVQWRGSRLVEASTATYWAVGVPIAGAEQATSVEGPRSDGVVSRLRFANGFESESRAWGNAPGLIRHRVPPQANLTDGTVVSPGYPWFPHGAEFPVEVEVGGAAATLEGVASYRSAPEGSDVARAEDALLGSRFEVSSRLAPLGSTVRVQASFESLVETLADVGATDVEVSVALHAPPSIGCEPTMTWRADAGSLPLGEVRAMALWEPDGMPALFVTGDDEKAHRADAVGRPRWSRALGAPGTALAPARAGPLAEPLLVVGDAHGGVRALDPLTGEARWNVSLAARGMAPGPPDAVVALRADDARGDVLAASASGRVALLDLASGALRAEWTAPERVVAAERAPEGRAVVLTPARAWLRDAALGPVADAAVALPAAASAPASFGSLVGSGGGWLTVAPAGAFVTGDFETRLLSLDDLAELRRVAHPEGVSLATGADADVDGARDHVVALQGATLLVLDGETGEARRWGRTDVTARPPEGVDATFVAARALADVACAQSARTYRPAGCELAGEAIAEAAPGEARASVGTSLLVFGTSRGLVHAWKRDAGPVLEQRDASGRVAWATPVSAARVPTLAAEGAWTTGPSVAFAEADGRVSLRPLGEPEERDRVATGGFTGRFGFAMRVPEGGFFGTHLLVATLAWEEGGVAREARLAEWFEVVNPDGSPNLHPAYRVVLVLQDLADPRGG